jgi:hypothetical protein
MFYARSIDLNSNDNKHRNQLIIKSIFGIRTENEEF